MIGDEPEPSIVVLPDDHTGFLINALFSGMTSTLEAGYLEDADDQFIFTQPLNYRCGLPIPDPAELFVGLHCELPPTVGTDAFCIVPYALQDNLLAAGAANTGCAFSALSVVIEKIGGQHVPAKPAVHALGKGAQIPELLRDLFLTPPHSELGFLIPDALLVNTQHPGPAT